MRLLLGLYGVIIAWSESLAESLGITDSLVLDLLSVDPEHQSAGAGTKLIQWGLAEADRMGAEVSLDKRKMMIDAETLLDFS